MTTNIDEIPKTGMTTASREYTHPNVLVALPSKTQDGGNVQLSNLLGEIPTFFILNVLIEFFRNTPSLKLIPSLKTTIVKYTGG